jgi:Right handed beta helix region
MGNNPPKLGIKRLSASCLKIPQNCIFLLGLTACISSNTLSASVDIYVTPPSVSSIGGGDGSKWRPFTSIDAARNAIRKITKDQDITVWINGGEYSGGIKFGPEDSGTAAHPITYRAIEGQTPRITGTKKLAIYDFKKISDSSALQKVKPEFRDKILELDLIKEKINNIEPYEEVFTGSGRMIDVFFDGNRLDLSRYPKSEYMRFNKVLNNGDSQQNSGATNNPPATPTTTISTTAKSNSTSQYKIKEQSKKKFSESELGGIFEYRPEEYSKMESWKSEVSNGLWLKGYWRVAWVVNSIKVKNIDTTNHTIKFSQPIAGGIGNKYTRPAGNGREAYWVGNLLSEISSPGEWSVDTKNKKLYLYPPQSVNPKALGALSNPPIRIADDLTPLITLNKTSHLIFQGLNLEENLGEGIKIEDGEENLIAGCTMKNLDKYAVVVDGGKNNTILSNDLYHLGSGGVWLGGGNEESNPRVPAGHKVMNNHIHDFSELDLVYSPAINCGYTGGGGGGHHTAVGMYIAYNFVHDTPHGGILFGSMDNIFEFNEVTRWCQVSNDLGAFYSYDRREGHFGNNTFRYNLMHNSKLGDGIYFDFDHPDMKLIGNIAALNSDGKRGIGYLFKIGNMGKDNVPQAFECKNNIAYNCKTGFEFVSLLPHQGEIVNNISACCREPMAWREIKDGKTKRAIPFTTEKNLDIKTNPGFKNPEALDFSITEDSLITKELPNFRPIPTEKIGLYKDYYRKSLPKDEEVDRLSKNHPQNTGLGYDILDRPN